MFGPETMMSAPVHFAALVDFDASFLFHLALFITTAVILNVVVFKPMLRVEALRHSRTQGAIADAERMQADAQSKVSRYEEAAAQARREGAAAFAQKRDEAQKAAQAQLDRARAGAQTNLDKGLADLAGKYDLARRQITPRAKELGEKIADKVLGS
jgi:F0F1-type ATP synthase membrane subunit b/b'